MTLDQISASLRFLSRLKVEAQEKRAFAQAMHNLSEVEQYNAVLFEIHFDEVAYQQLLTAQTSDESLHLTSVQN